MTTLTTILDLIAGLCVAADFFFPNKIGEKAGRWLVLYWEQQLRGEDNGNKRLDSDKFGMGRTCGHYISASIFLHPTNTNY